VLNSELSKAFPLADWELLPRGLSARTTRARLTPSAVRRWTAQPPLLVAAQPLFSRVQSSPGRNGVAFAKTALQVGAGRVQRQAKTVARVLHVMCGAIAARQALLRRNLELERLSRTDDLTSVHNRRSIDECLRNALDRAARGGGTVSALLFDVDDFKSVNDHHGHLAGDLVLREIVRRIDDALRLHDILGRWGGEEFLVIAPRTDTQGALALAERIRLLVSRQPFVVGNSVVNMTISCGCATSNGEDPQNVVRRADAGLYLAKRLGRDRVIACDRAGGRDDGSESRSGSWGSPGVLCG
jgi:two-component system, cell cycle response regulator